MKTQLSSGQAMFRCSQTTFASLLLAVVLANYLRTVHCSPWNQPPVKGVLSSEVEKKAPIVSPREEALRRIMYFLVQHNQRMLDRGSKRIGSEFIGKREDPLMADRLDAFSIDDEDLTFNDPEKRLGSEFLGKRKRLGSEFLGKRKRLGSEFLGKRFYSAEDSENAPSYQFVYQKDVNRE